MARLRPKLRFDVFRKYTPSDFQNSQLFFKLQEALAEVPARNEFQVISFFNQSETVEFAFNRISSRLLDFSCHREFKRLGGNPWETSKVHLKNNKTGDSLTIPGGEDPRLFKFCQSLWVYFQVFEPDLMDTRIFIKNLETLITYELRSPTGFNGKNWVPITFNNSLYFLYSLDPLQILKVPNLDSEFIELDAIYLERDFSYQWNVDFEKSFRKIRGGTRAIEINGRWFGFSHNAGQGEGYAHHSLGFYEIELERVSIKHSHLTNQKSNFLIDPYGVVRKRNRLFVYCSIALNDIHHDNSQVANIILKFKISDLLKLID